MPVGTRLELRNDRESHLVRVVKVTESAEAGHAGISVKPAGHPEPVEFFSDPEPVVAPAPVPAPAPVAAAAPKPAVVNTGNGLGKTATASGTLGASAPAPTAAASTETSDGVPDNVIDPEDTGSTSEYPAISNGAAGKKRRQKKKPR